MPGDDAQSSESRSQGNLAVDPAPGKDDTTPRTEERDNKNNAPKESEEATRARLRPHSVISVDDKTALAQANGKFDRLSSYSHVPLFELTSKVLA